MHRDHYRADHIISCENVNGFNDVRVRGVHYVKDSI